MLPTAASHSFSVISTVAGGLSTSCDSYTLGTVTKCLTLSRRNVTLAPTLVRPIFPLCTTILPPLTKPFLREHRKAPSLISPFAARSCSQAFSSNIVSFCITKQPGQFSATPLTFSELAMLLGPKCFFSVLERHRPLQSLIQSLLISSTLWKTDLSHCTNCNCSQSQTFFHVALYL